MPDEVLTDNGKVFTGHYSPKPVEPPADPLATVTRKVARNGIISVSGQVFSVGAALAGKVVTVHVDDDLLHVWCQGARVRTVLRKTRGEVRKKNARRY